ncbi:hypothetical protein MOJ79_16415 [Calidifontimicrobium sp. SYSU G02091]|uniref:hypothetical protein n=1 Tax=Calidifontimicrobium sp. SYSU G02091 TaxID=2926421 RepID=UPI001F532656|nr:hypothetical protein [Calidifontimicrobium sp. SYSU G02091]MCI1193419.1 hypothetical protein [Calidifontimicrobium sp. SYSU G02091]
MSRNRAKTANPVLDGTIDVPPAAPAGTLRLLVRTVSVHGDYGRYRAGLGPFGREPVVVCATPQQAQALRADPALAVAELGG